MSKKRGLSAEEKRTKMLEIFTESLDVFQLKDLEKIGPKKKGIISQSVKEVVTSLVGDGLVDQEKIGTSTYFWSFPSKLNQAKKARLESMVNKVAEVQNKHKMLQEQLQEHESGDDDKENKAVLMEQLLALRSERDQLKAEIKKYADVDPEQLQKYTDEIDYAKDGIVRWTDNVFQTRSWVKEKTGNDEAAVNKMFNIPNDFDYPE